MTNQKSYVAKANLQTNEAMADAEVDVPQETPTAEAIQDWLVAHLVEQMDIASHEIDILAPFDSYGLDSMIMVSLTGELEDWLGCQLSPNLLYEYTTIETLSQYLAQEVKSSR